MNVWRVRFTRFAAAAAGLFAIAATTVAATLDRHYKMGDDPAEGAFPGSAVSGSCSAGPCTYDSVGVPLQNQLVDLLAVNSPNYVTILDRPDRPGPDNDGLGIQFNAAQQEYLHGFNLGYPQHSFSAATHHTPSGGALDYLGISDRGFQFWVKPTSTAEQSIVMDTERHGVRINDNGRFSMRYGNADYESDVAVTPNTWYHIEVVRPAGAENGARMYVNGVAVVAAEGDYEKDNWADLTVGANTAGDDQLSPGFTGGTDEFFSGIVDELKMFVIGTTTSPTTPVNYGGFNLTVDNDFVASPVSGIKNVAGDVTNDGVLNQADKDAFIGGWMEPNMVGVFQIGDMASRAQGDLNLDGITNIKDLLLIQNALSGAGLATITAADLEGGVPEPSSAVLALLSIAPLSRFMRSRARRP
jgi:hypothetical protein